MACHGSMMVDSLTSSSFSNVSQNSFSDFLHSGPKRLPNELPNFFGNGFPGGLIVQGRETSSRNGAI